MSSITSTQNYRCLNAPETTNKSKNKKKKNKNKKNKKQLQATNTSDAATEQALQDSDDDSSPEAATDTAESSPVKPEVKPSAPLATNQVAPPPKEVSPVSASNVTEILENAQLSDQPAVGAAVKSPESAADIELNSPSEPMEKNQVGAEAANGSMNVDWFDAPSGVPAPMQQQQPMVNQPGKEKSASSERTGDVRPRHDSQGKGTNDSTNGGAHNKHGKHQGPKQDSRSQAENKQDSRQKQDSHSPAENKQDSRQKQDSHNQAENRQDSRHGEKKRKSRFDDPSDGKKNKESKSRAHKNQPNIPGLHNPSSTREVSGDREEQSIVAEMKGYLMDTKKANLEEFQGHVYLSKLAELMRKPQPFLNRLAIKYSSDFSVFTDGQNNVNIGLQRNGGGGGGSSRGNDSDTRLSKMLVGLLRHRAEHKGFNFMEGGYLFVSDILKSGQYRDYKEEDVKRIVKNNDKQRFGLENHPKTKQLMIRANQGHSIQTVDAAFLKLKEMTGKDVPCCVHGTHLKAWESIKTTGLNAMTRNEIHFAQGEPGESGVISGMRSSSEVLIFVDVDKAIAGGITFYRSANNVILSAGDKQKSISPEYFSHVIDRKTRKSLNFSSEKTRRDSYSKSSRDNSPAAKKQHSSVSTNQQQGQRDRSKQATK